MLYIKIEIIFQMKKRNMMDFDLPLKLTYDFSLSFVFLLFSLSAKENDIYNQN